MPEEVHEPPQTTNDVLALTIQPIVYFFVLPAPSSYTALRTLLAFGKKCKEKLRIP